MIDEKEIEKLPELWQERAGNQGYEANRNFNLGVLASAFVLSLTESCCLTSSSILDYTDL